MISIKNIFLYSFTLAMNVTIHYIFYGIYLFNSIDNPIGLLYFFIMYLVYMFVVFNFEETKEALEFQKNKKLFYM
jgi:hypothetical protein